MVNPGGKLLALFVGGLFAYRQNPHADAKPAAIRAAEKLGETLARGDRVRTFHRAVPLLYPPPATATDRDPMRALAALAAGIEAADPEVLGVNVVAGFAFADTPFTGLSFMIALRSSGVIGPIRPVGGRTMIRSTMAGVPLPSRNDTSASPLPSSVMTWAVLSFGFGRNVCAAAATAF